MTLKTEIASREAPVLHHTLEKLTKQPTKKRQRCTTRSSNGRNYFILNQLAFDKDLPQPP